MHTVFYDFPYGKGSVRVIQHTPSSRWYVRHIGWHAFSFGHVLLHGYFDRDHAIFDAAKGIRRILQLNKNDA